MQPATPSPCVTSLFLSRPPTSACLIVNITVHFILLLWPRFFTHTFLYCTHFSLSCAQTAFRFYLFLILFSLPSSSSVFNLSYAVRAFISYIHNVPRVSIKKRLEVSLTCMRRKYTLRLSHLHAVLYINAAHTYNVPRIAYKTHTKKHVCPLFLAIL